MPIYKNEADGSLVVHCGVGDILICDVLGPASEIIFSQDVRGEIGRAWDGPRGRTSAELKHPVRLVFENVSSLDVLLDALNKLRARMEANRGEVPDAG